MQAIHSLFSEERPGDFPVFHREHALVQWDEFAGHVCSLVEALQGRPEKRWLLESSDAGEFLTHFLAAIYAGKEIVIPPNTQPGTLEKMSRCVDARFVGIVPDAKAKARILPPIDPQTATIDLYTSGSTGEPKEIRKTLLEFERELDVLQALWGEALGSSVVMGTVLHQHVYGLFFRLLWPLSAGRVFDTVICSHPGILEERLRLFDRVTLISSPAHLSRLPELLALEKLAPTLKHIFSSGGPLPLGTSDDFFHSMALRPTEIFGSTETGALAWRKQEKENGGIWMPLPGLAVERTEEGALRLHSPFVNNGGPYEMSDAIDLLPDGRFLLRGRLDRVVKIEEKRLSLPEMEFHLNEHPWIHSSALVSLLSVRQERERQSIGAVVVLSREGKRQLAAEGRRAMTWSLREYLSVFHETVLLPKYWRFVEHLPVNERGKITQTDLEQLFDGVVNKEDEPLLFPSVCQAKYSCDDHHEVCLTLHVPTDLEHFSGHFPEAPILPGVVQVDWAVHFARQYLKLPNELMDHFSALENLKFLSPVPPDICFDLSLKWHDESCRLDFSYSTQKRKYATGRILFGNG